MMAKMMKFAEFTSNGTGKRVSIDTFSILHVSEMEDGTDIIIDTMLADKEGAEPACITVTESYDEVMERIRVAMEGM